MDEINDGGPAFAATYEEYDNDSERWRVVSSGGMTLRDYFAAKALQVVHYSGGRYGDEGLKQVAEQAYAVADAMLKAREAQ